MNVHPTLYIVLFIAACLAFPPLIVLGLFYPFVKHFVWKMVRLQKPDYSIKKHFLPIFMVLALILDKLANAIAGELLNDTLLKKDPRHVYHKQAYKYGKTYDTISEVTGVNEIRKTLNKFGVWFTKMLGVVLNDNHSILSMNLNRKYPPHTKR